MRPLTERQLAAVEKAKERWIEWIFSTEPAGREQAEAGVRQTYRAAGRPEPEIFLWFDDLLLAMLATEQLDVFHEFNWQLPPESLPMRTAMQETIQTRLGLGAWPEVLEAVGPKETANRSERRIHKGVAFGVAVPRKDCIQAGLPTWDKQEPCPHETIEEAAKSIDRAAWDFHSQLADMVDRASGPGRPGHPGVTHGFRIYQLDYRHIQLFRHDCLSSICGETASHAYEGLIQTVRHAGPWWAFANGVVLCDRPKSIERDADGNLHCANAPAATYRTGLELFAWHGVPVPSEAILHPESLTHSFVNGQFGTKLKQALIEIYGKERFERERRPPPPRKPRHPFVIGMPQDFSERLEKLDIYGPRPFLDRYLAGEQQKVWADLCALGDAVRELPYAADALSVAYHVMRTVGKNLETIVDRLIGTGYDFTPPPPDRIIPMEESIRQFFAGKPLPVPNEATYPLMGPEKYLMQGFWRLEKDAGQLPLAVRAWYEIVGPVSLLGAFRSEGCPAIPQFAVVPFGEIVREWDNSPLDAGPEEKPFSASITRHDPPYRITLPAPVMDAPLENQPDRLNFLDWLRRELDRCAAALDLKLLLF